MSASFSPAQWRQAGILTAAAAALLAGLNFFRMRPDLTHMDFVTGGPGSLEFCDPANPRFLPVVARPSPVVAELRTAAPAVARGQVEAVLVLRTNTGKPIGPRDLRLTEAGKMSLLLVDPKLTDFQAQMPSPGPHPGEWSFAFIPRGSGTYRVFADFTPEATGQEMYASADLAVAGSGTADSMVEPARKSAVVRAGWHLALRPSVAPIRAREAVDLDFTVARLDGSAAALQPVDGFPARLVAFDRNRTGFVNLRPEPGLPPDNSGAGLHLTFKVTIPDPGNYVIWSRISDRRTEVDTPFSLEVEP
jgi:hypothetical protein